MNIDAAFLLELGSSLQENRSQSSRILHDIRSLEASFLVRSQIEDIFKALAADDPALLQTPFGAVLRLTQQVVLSGSWVYFAVRRRIGRWSFLRLHFETLDIEEITVREYLHFEERVARRPTDQQEFHLEIDLEPFERGLPKMTEIRSIGRGVEYLNRRLSSQLFTDRGDGTHPLLDFLRVHKYRGQQLMIGQGIENLKDLRTALRAARVMLESEDPETLWAEIEPDLHRLGFEAGWGKDAVRTRETMGMLLEILEAPSPLQLEEFLGRIPMIFSLAIVSPHGWFGQSGVLGRPDTGGQIVYILDQVRALEKEMRTRLLDQGLEIEPQIVILSRLIPEAEGTTCDERLEPVAGTKNTRILRVPFRDSKGEVLPQWVSRFEIWPYLEQYAFEAGTELLAELGERPDLVIGNYSDGNLVASLIAGRLKVTMCTIAHALEKSKYANSDLFWQDNEEQYHFSAQFTADLISMNAADFIITSSYQEIAGTKESLGQYESYSFFTMPQLYRVLQGIDVYDPKFNIVSPGADPDVYFPATESARRLTHLDDEIQELVYGNGAGSEFRGNLETRDKPLLFTMARMDRIKNITGLLEWYGESPELRREANLLIASGYVVPDRSKDAEERAGIEKMHDLFDRYELDGQVRWVEGQVDKERNGELYRFIADGHGAFVQPAIFEAFGLTVIESMSTGLPTFATCFGGPLEIIEDGISGYHIDPNHGDQAAAKIAAFFASCAEDESLWDAISRGSLDRVEALYTWKGYANRLMTLSRIYGFWRYVTDLERTETKRYLEMMYALQYRPIAQAMVDDPEG
jgi:sucrose synthase